MQVILLEKVANLGDLGDQVSVKPGFGRNFLIPFGKAVPATKANIADFESRRAELEAASQARIAEAQQRAEKMDGLLVTIARVAGDEGKLFGSVGTRDLAEAISQAAGLEVTKKEVCLPNGVIRDVGDYDIDLQLHSEVMHTVKVAVVAE